LALASSAARACRAALLASAPNNCHYGERAGAKRFSRLQAVVRRCQHVKNVWVTFLSLTNYLYNTTRWLGPHAADEYLTHKFSNFWLGPVLELRVLALNNYTPCHKILVEAIEWVIANNTSDTLVVPASYPLDIVRLIVAQVPQAQ
jgi:hypothetical protein